ncbi:MAG: DUF2905 domain-containing protein [Candidatus Manganitrophaceae bacterium]|nr:MAG: DUF2905 domain-containing protein [Candidatus Manganitrophaceae bacterium]
MADLGRLLIFLGLLLALIGGVMLFAGKIPGLGRLPGDILIQRRNVTFYFPIATSLLISIVLSLIFWLLSRR